MTGDRQEPTTFRRGFDGPIVSGHIDRSLVLHRHSARNVFATARRSSTYSPCDGQLVNAVNRSVFLEPKVIEPDVQAKRR